MNSIEYLQKVLDRKLQATSTDFKRYLFEDWWLLAFQAVNKKKQHIALGAISHHQPLGQRRNRTGSHHPADLRPRFALEELAEGQGFERVCEEEYGETLIIKNLRN